MYSFYYHRFRLFLCALTLGIGAISSLSFAQSLDTSSDLMNTPAVIEADQLEYDSNKSVVKAKGKVEVIQGDRQLTADSIEYEQELDRISARGNVVLHEPDGSILTAKEVSLQDSLNKGTLTDLNALFKDQSHASATSGERLDQNITVLTNATYSACPVCKSEPEKAPVWQISAKRTYFNEKKERISYRHAFFEIYGVPVIYTPYFAHASPKAKRKTGALTPSYRNDSVFGTSIELPVYVNIAPNKDLTLTPRFTSKEGNILEAEYRHLLPSGSYELRGSITNPDRVNDEGITTEGNDIRGHIEGQGKFKLNEDWSWGFEGKRATDDTYLRKYRFSEEDTLTSLAYVDYIKDRQFFEAETITFQGLQATDDPGLTPLVLPHLRGQWQTEKGNLGDHFGIDMDALSLTREEGISSHRVSFTGYWSLPYITRSGHVFEWKNSLRTDGYAIDDASPIAQYEGNVARIIPETTLSWSYPLISYQANRRVLIEPIANVTLSPNGNYADDIPNEDSQDVEFSDINLFYSNHFAALDRLESGPRANYGVKMSVDHDTMGQASLLLGQTYQMRQNEDFTVGSGLDDNQSDLVGRVAYNYHDRFDVAYQFRIDKSELDLTRNLVHTGFTYDRFTFNVDYLSLNENYENNIDINNPDRQYVLAGARVKLNDNWQLAGSGNHDLDDGAWRFARGSLEYLGNCYGLSLLLDREFTRDRDISPSTSISFQVSLKNVTD